MKFYELDCGLSDAVTRGGLPLRLKIEIDAGGFFVRVCENDILQADFFSLKKAGGGVSARGELLLDNARGLYSFCDSAFGSKVLVSFSLGGGLPYFLRFVFYIDEKGVQDIRGPGRKRFARIVLRDLSAVLRKSGEARDWSSREAFAHSVVCDKARADKSLVHLIAARAGLGGGDIDCATVPVTVPFVRLRRNSWQELSSLAAAYRAHLECTAETPLVFSYSPYQSEAAEHDGVAHVFSGDSVFYLRVTDRRDLYRNDVRLKVNMPVSLERQEIWRYEDAPFFYDENYRRHYPFRHPLVREIEAGRYEAEYNVVDAGGKRRGVVYADEVDCKEEAEKRLVYSGGGFSYAHYDAATHFDRAVLQLKKEHDGDLSNASIHGRPIVVDYNRSCFRRDAAAVEKFGTFALNVTGSYFSDYIVRDSPFGETESKAVPHYEDWVDRELALRLHRRREFVVKTHLPLFNARVGAVVKIELKNDVFYGKIDAFSLRYRRERAFVGAFKIMELGEIYGQNEWREAGGHDVE